MKILLPAAVGAVAVLIAACAPPASEEAAPLPAEETAATRARVEPHYFLGPDETHNRFSRAIPPALTVPSGAVVEVRTHEASHQQLTADSTPEDGPPWIDGAGAGFLDDVALFMQQHDLRPVEYPGTFQTVDVYTIGLPVRTCSAPRSAMIVVPDAWQLPSTPGRPARSISSSSNSAGNVSVLSVK